MGLFSYFSDICPFHIGRDSRGAMILFETLVPVLSPSLVACETTSTSSQDLPMDGASAQSLLDGGCGSASMLLVSSSVT